MAWPIKHGGGRRAAWSAAITSWPQGQIGLSGRRICRGWPPL